MMSVMTRNKKFLIAALFATLPLLMAQPSRAYTLLPSDISVAAGATQTLKVLANGEAKANGVELRMALTNLEVVDVQVRPGLMSLATCSNQKSFTTTTVCVDIAGSTDFKSGDELATVTVRKTGNDGAVIKASGKYSSGTKIDAVVAKTGGVTSADNPVIDETASNNLVILVIAAFAILALVVSGVALSRFSSRRVRTTGGVSPVARHTPSDNPPLPTAV